MIGDRVRVRVRARARVRVRVRFKVRARVASIGVKFTEIAPGPPSPYMYPILQEPR